jgi:hypothetical protein
MNLPNGAVGGAYTKKFDLPVGFRVALPLAVSY